MGCQECTGGANYCQQCNGGRNPCKKCNASGRILCSACEGYRMIKYSKELEVKYSTGVSKHVQKSSGVPDHVVQGARGTPIVSKSAVALAPVTGFADPKLDQVSRQFAEAHSVTYNNGYDSRIIQQAHSLTVARFTTSLRATPTAAPGTSGSSAQTTP